MARLPVLLATVLAAGGCAVVGPDYVRPAIDAPAAWRVSPEQGEALANTAWWSALGDPVLDGLIRTALENNRDVRIAAERVLEFAARVDVTRAGTYPQLGYEGAGARGRSIVPGVGGATGNSFAANLNVGWELDVWGRIQRATEAARANLLAAEEVRRSVILTLVSTVASSYVRLLTLDDQLGIARKTVDSRAKSLALFDLQFEGGIVSELEVAQVRSEYELAQTRIPEIERQIARLENALSVLLGRNPGPVTRGRSSDTLALPPVPAGVPSDLLERRPDIRAAEQQLIAANALIGVARAQYFPRISLTGLFGYASDDLSDLLQDSSNVWSAGGGLLGPIFDGGRIAGDVRATEAAQRQAVLNYQNAILTALREVDDALIDHRKTREIVAAQERQLDALRTYAEFANLRYDEGQVSYIEVLDAERRLFDAELTNAVSSGDVFIALIDVYKAMGGGWVELAEQTANAVDFPPSGDAARGGPLAPQATQPAALRRGESTDAPTPR
jgi:multidrug efflux system outer membrane protein